MGKPSNNAYRQFRLEEATVTGVNRKTWTVDVATRHSAKPVYDIQAMSPYHHYQNGEGIHHLPEVGAVCLLAWPSDHTPPVIIGYLGMPGVSGAEAGGNTPAVTDAAPSNNTVSYQSRRPDMNPGDIALTGRDENFLLLRRGGVLQLGATAMAQRIYIPVGNYIKDFAENYQMQTPAGEMRWSVKRQELDPAGKAAGHWELLLNEYAQDASATVRISHFQTQGRNKSAWDIQVAPQGINRRTGEVTGAVYNLRISLDGDRTEFVGGDHTVTVSGNYSLDVEGNLTTAVGADYSLTARTVSAVASGEAVLGGRTVRAGSSTAASPGVLGDMLVQWLAIQQWPVNPNTNCAAPTPAALLALRDILSSKVFIE